MQLYVNGTLSAKTCSALYWWVSGFHDGDVISKLGMRLGRASGHYQHHLGAALGLREVIDKLYRIQVPVHRRHDLSRCTHKMPTVPGHEYLNEEFLKDASISVKLREEIAIGGLPPAYFDHPVTKSGGAVIPFAIYMDGVAYSLTDTVLGVWFVNFITEVKHLSVVLRKRLGCRCGYRTWCSLFPISEFLHWCVASMAAGVYPGMQHDTKEWNANSDSLQSDRDGTPLKMKGCCLYIKGDWSEYCSTLGFPAWNSPM